METSQDRAATTTQVINADEVVRGVAIARRNFKLGVANGVLGGLMDPLSGVFVITLFLTTLNGPQFLVGLLPAMWSWGILLPQMIVAGKVRGKRRVMPWYKGAAVIRVTGMVGMTVSAAVVLLNRDLVLLIFFVSYLVYAVGCGVSGIPFIEVVGKIVPDHRKGSFFGYRQFGSGAMSIFASAVAGIVIAEHLGLKFPYNFAAMFGFATIVGVIVFWLWTRVDEPDLVAVKAPETASVFKLGLRALRSDRDYRLFTIVRLLATFAGIAGPFYLVFVTKVMRVPLDAMGIYMMASTGVSLFGGLLWAPVANRTPRHKLIAISTGLQFANAICSVLVIALAGNLSAEIAPFAAAPVFLMGGLASSAAVMFNDTTLLSIAPDGERPTYFGFLNTLAGTASFVLPLGGLMLEAWGYLPLFALATTLAAAAFLAALSLSVSSARLRRPSFIPRLTNAISRRRADKTP